MFTPVHTSVTVYALRAIAVSGWIFPLQKLLFFDLRLILLKLHILAHLLKSFPTVYSLCEFRERASHGLGNTVLHLSWLVQTCSNIFTPVHTCTHLFTPVHNSSHLFTHVHNSSHLFTPQWLRSSRIESFSSEPVQTGSQYSALVRSSPNVIFCTFETLLFFSLTSYPGEIAYFNSPNRQIPMVYALWRCIEVKLSIPPGAHA